MGNLIRLLTWGLLLYVGYRIIIGFIKGKQKEQVAPPVAPKGEETRLDPVCGTYVAMEDAIVGRNGDERIYFCSMECLEKHRAQLEQQAALK